MEMLRQDVLAAHIQPDITVQMVVERTGGEAIFNKALASAHQVGGPRWLDEQVAQVRVEINGAPVADALEEMSRNKPKALPISPSTVHDRLKRWPRRTFSAIGTSTSASAVDRLRPDPNQISWKGVNDQICRHAIEAARQDAVRRVIDSLKPITWDDNQNLGKLLDLPEVRQKVSGWLVSRPVTSVEFRDNLEIRLTLAAQPTELWPVLKDALTNEKPRPETLADWEHIRQQVDMKMASPAGVAAATRPAASAGAAVALPSQAPAWTTQTLSARGSAASAAGLLRAARAAKLAALEELRAQVEALPLSANLTLGDAAKKDARIAAALERGIERAQVANVEYDSPQRGSATTRLTLDLEEVWRELARLQQ